jgi:hypothetical protein
MFKKKLTEQEKMDACNKEITAILNKYGYTLQIAQLIQFKKADVYIGSNIYE